MKITPPISNIKVSRSVKKLGSEAVIGLSEALSSPEVRKASENKTIKIKRGGISNLEFFIKAKEKLSINNLFKKRYVGKNTDASRSSNDIKEAILKSISNIQKVKEETIQRKAAKQQDKKIASDVFKKIQSNLK